MKYYLIAGEASGDLHGSNLIKSLIKQDPDAQFRYYGGEKMLAEGGELVKNYKDTAIMGFMRVALNAHKIIRTIKECKEDIAAFAPDVLVLIDYPGFNLDIAVYAKRVLKLKVVYYIPPKVWAWGKLRVKIISKYVDKVYCIFPFEVDFYREHGLENVVYVGNPCVQSVTAANHIRREDFFIVNELDPSKKIIALLPGSRVQEIEKTIPLFNGVDKSLFSDYQFVLAATSAVDSAIYEKVSPDIKVVYDLTYQLLMFSDAAVVNSGTATLETALLNVPQIVVYPMTAPRLLYKFARRYLLKVPHISLVNIISGQESVKELVAHDCTVDNITANLQTITFDNDARKAIVDDYKKIAATLGDGIASDIAAKDIVS